MICFFAPSTINSDSRLQKYVCACKSTGTNYLAITWNRLLKEKEVDANEFQFQKYAPYGYGKRMHNFFLLLLWYCFAIRILVKERKNYQIIHACNLHTVIIAYIFKVLLGKKYVFDIYDTSGHFRAERFFARKADLFILPHNQRLEQMSQDVESLKRFLVVENVPVYKKPQEHYSQENRLNEIHFSYVGSFERNIRGLENLLKVVEEYDNCYLEIAGSGDGLDKKVKETGTACDRIKYLGMVSHDKAMDIMGKSDYIFAMYNHPISHKYACPNKYYESLILGRPIVTTKDTSIGNWVEKNKTGYAIGPELSDLEELVTYLCMANKEEYEKLSANCLRCWNEQYSDYQEAQLNKAYINICKEIAK